MENSTAFNECRTRPHDLSAASDDENILHQFCNHWLPIRMRVIFKICTYIFKIMHGLAPGYLNCAVVFYYAVNGVLPEQEVLPEPFTPAEKDADQ